MLVESKKLVKYGKETIRCKTVRPYPTHFFRVEPVFGPKIQAESGRVGRVHLAALM